MSTIDETHPDQGILCSKDFCIDLIQLIPAQVIVAVSSRTGKIGFSHPVFLKSGEHLLCILLRNRIDTGKSSAQISLSLTAQRSHLITNL